VCRQKPNVLFVPLGLFQTKKHLILYFVEHKKEWSVKTSDEKQENLFFCFEHTGLYSYAIAAFLSAQKISYSMVAALEIKKSMGMVRGKNDRVDAKRIAEYAFLRKDNIKPYSLPSKKVLKLHRLISLRDRIVKQRAGYLADIKELKSTLKRMDHQLVFKIQEQLIAILSKKILKIENEIINTIKSEEQLNKLFELITSIKGIGLILATNLLVTTNCFSRFDNSRKYACYAGIAPFEYQSGTSLRKASKVNHMANKKMKSLLNMAAFSAIIHDPELKKYYHRRVDEGKSKMSTINIIRNKIIHRVFAVVKRETPYVSLHLYSS
jgi:transposase